jgi:tetratricopeptide (TPR) repeat protein
LIRSSGSAEALRRYAEGLVALAHQAYIYRRFDLVEHACRPLIGLPLPEKYHNIGLYYKALCVKREGRIEEARSLLSEVAERASPQYRARATMSLAAIAIDLGDYDTALLLHTEAGWMATNYGCEDLFAAVHARKMIAVIKSVWGDHRGALADLEGLWPVVSAVKHHLAGLYYDYLNSLAVEMAAVGKLSEAERVSRIVQASPLARAYPEWRQTYSDIARKIRQPSGSILIIGNSVAVEPASARDANKTESHEPTPIGSEPRPVAHDLAGAGRAGAQLVQLAKPDEEVGVLPRGPSQPSSESSVRPSEKVALFPLAEQRAAEPTPWQAPSKAVIVDLQAWREKKKKPPLPDKTALRLQIMGMSRAKKRVRMVELIYTDGLSKETLEGLLEFGEIFIPAQLSREKINKILDMVWAAVAEEHSSQR